MNSKKITAVLLVVGVVASTCTLFNVKGAFAESLKQDVVYTKCDTSTVSKNNIELSESENKVIKEKSSQVLKKYFNISTEKNENLEYSSIIVNEKTLVEMESREEKMLQSAHEKKEISDEDYNKQKSEIPGRYKVKKEMVKNLKHGLIQALWFSDKECYFVFFDENTKEVEFAIGDSGKHSESDVALKLSEEQVKDTAKDFIEQNKLGNLEKPKCVFVKGTSVFYQDENDASKKVKVKINPYTGKVSSFAVKSYANMLYDDMSSGK